MPRHIRNHDAPFVPPAAARSSTNVGWFLLSSGVWSPALPKQTCIGSLRNPNPSSRGRVGTQKPDTHVFASTLVLARTYIRANSPPTRYFHQAFCAQLQAALTTAAWKMNFRGLELLRTCHITKDVLFLDDSMSRGRVCPPSVGGTRNFDFAHFSNKMSQLHSLVWICLLQGPELTAS